MIGRARAQTTKPRFLFVIGGTGGASIIDAFLAIRAGESGAPARINCFPDAEVLSIAGSPLRAVELSNATLTAPGFMSLPITFDPAMMRSFAERRKQDMLVATMTTTSVNHVVGQKRAITGNGAWSGRTLQEAVATEYGAGLLLPNVNMAFGGFLEDGADPSIGTRARKEPLAAHPVLWTFSTDGSRGIKDLPSRALIDRARRVRDEALDPASPFYAIAAPHPKVVRWLEQRGDGREAIEAADLITKLQFAPNLLPNVPLTEHGLSESPDGARIRQIFPNWLDDTLEAQAALAFLLVKNGLSAAVTISPSFNPILTSAGLVNAPLSFDYSHNNHRLAQASMWSRILSIIDRLIGLLESELDRDGETLWSRSMIYVATDFGRTKQRPENPSLPEGDPVFGSGHNLDNGVLVISPLVRGNTVLGAADPNTGLTTGFDPVSGAGAPGVATEPMIFAGLLQALGIDTSGTSLPDVPAMVRST
jgi:hypothetical protein